MTRGRKCKMRAVEAADKAEAVDVEECAWGFPEWGAARGVAEADGGVAEAVKMMATASGCRKC